MLTGGQEGRDKDNHSHALLHKKQHNLKPEQLNHCGVSQLQRTECPGFFYLQQLQTKLLASYSLTHISITHKLMPVTDCHKI